MQKLIFKNANGIELNLTDGQHFGITEWAGLSADDLEVQSQQVPFQDGSVFLDAIYGQREIAVTVAMYDGGSLNKRYELRRELIKGLNAKLGEGVLIYENDFLKKQIKAVPHLPEFENHNSNDSGTPKANIVFECCNPYWEDVDYTEINLLGGQRTAIEIEGDVCSPVDIDYSGFASTFIIDNLTTGKSIELKDIGSNRRIDISTYVGKKSVYATELEKENKYFAIKCDYMQNLEDDYMIYIKINNSTKTSVLYIEGQDGSFKTSSIPFEIVAWYNNNARGNNFIHYSERQGKYYITGYNSDFERKFAESTDLINWTVSNVGYWQEHDYLFRYTVQADNMKWEIAKVQTTMSWTDISSTYDTDYFYWNENGYYHIFDRGGVKYSSIGFLSSETILHEYSSYGSFWNVVLFGGYVFVFGNYGANPSVLWFDLNNAENQDLPPITISFQQPFVFNNQKYLSTDNGLVGEDFTNYGFFTIDGVKSRNAGAVWDNKIFLLYEAYEIETFFGYTENLTRVTKLEDVEITGLSIQNGIYYGYSEGKLYYSQNLARFYYWADCPVIDMFRDCLGAGSETGFELVNGNVVPFTHPLTSVHSIRKLNGKYYIAGADGLFESEDKITWTQVANEEVFDVAWTGQLVYFMDTKIQNGNTLIENTITVLKAEYSDYYNKFMLLTSSAIYVSTSGFSMTEITGLSGNVQDILYDPSGVLWWLLTDEKIYTYYRDLLSEMAIDGTGILALSLNGCVIVNCFLTECQYKSNTNIINHLSEDSNMSFCLIAGSNTVYFQGGQNDLIKIKYKNRFLGV